MGQPLPTQRTAEPQVDRAFMPSKPTAELTWEEKVDPVTVYGPDPIPCDAMRDAMRQWVT
jgi:hypothetical protein